MFHKKLLLVLKVSFVCLVASAYDWQFGNTSLMHCASAVCDPNTYMTRKYNQNFFGFIPVYYINDPVYDTKVVFEFEI